ncbi:ABC-2 family transporter protein [Microbacterium sp. SA39]|nr:ABC-2 family transporter protein [Microbacterium sp. SA39]
MAYVAAQGADDEPKGGSDAPQTLRRVLRAEWRALWSLGGIRVATVVAASVAIATGSAVFAVLRTIAREPGHVIVSAPVEASSTIFGLAFGLVVAIAVGRDAEGRLAFTMLRTPARSRLFVARVVSVTMIGMLGALVCSAAIAIIAVALSLPAAAKALPLLAVALIVCTAAVGLTIVLAFALSTIAWRSVAAVLVYLSLLILLPLALAIGGAAVPGALGSFLASASAWTPTPLLMQASAVSTMPSQGAEGVLTGILGLLGWVGATTVAAHVVFTRRDAP